MGLLLVPSHYSRTDCRRDQGEGELPKSLIHPSSIFQKSPIWGKWLEEAGVEAASQDTDKSEIPDLSGKARVQSF